MNEKMLISAAKKEIEELASYEVEPPEQYNTVKRKYLSPKLCYKKAYSYILSLKGKASENVKLVHGHYNHFPESFGHAWVELPGGIVFDGVLKRFYSRADYYKMKNLYKDAEYSKKEAHILALSQRHYGPWH